MNYLDSLTQDTDGNYLIATVDELLGLSDYVNSGNDCADLTFKLTNDLDFRRIDFTAIGYGSDYKSTGVFNPFKGKFDGDGHTISNLKIYSDVEALGLFGYVGTGGEIRNLILENVKIDGNNRVGSIAGENKGTITNCTVKNCDLKISNDETGDFWGVGSIVGLNWGEIIDCSTENCNLDGRWTIGGIVGANSGEIKNCKVVCSHINCLHRIGGLAGHNEFKISDCYAVIKRISSRSKSPKDFGAIVGYNPNKNQGLSVENCCYYLHNSNPIINPQAIGSGAGACHSVGKLSKIKTSLPSGVKAELKDGIIDDDDIYYKDGETLILSGTLSAGDEIDILGSQSNLKINGNIANIDGLTIKIVCEIPDNCELKVAGNKIICAAVENEHDDENPTEEVIEQTVDVEKTTPVIEETTPDVKKATRDIESEISNLEDEIIFSENTIRTTIGQLNKLMERIEHWKKNVDSLKSKLHK